MLMVLICTISGCGNKETNICVIGYSGEVMEYLDESDENYQEICTLTRDYVYACANKVDVSEAKSWEKVNSLCADEIKTSESEIQERIRKYGNYPKFNEYVESFTVDKVCMNSDKTYGIAHVTFVVSNDKDGSKSEGEEKPYYLFLKIENGKWLICDETSIPSELLNYYSV